MVGRILSMNNFAHRDQVLKLPESSLIVMNVRKRLRLPPNSTVKDPGRPVRMRKLLAPAVVLERTHLGQSLSLDQVEEPCDIAGEAVVDDVKENQRSQRKLKARRARRRTSVHSDLVKSAEADVMLEKLAASISRETLLAARPHRTRTH